MDLLGEFTTWFKILRAALRLRSPDHILGAWQAAQIYGRLQHPTVTSLRSIMVLLKLALMSCFCKTGPLQEIGLLNYHGCCSMTAL